MIPEAIPATPRRIQRKRTKGWTMPTNTVYVGRPTPFGNDWTVRDAAIRGVHDPLQQREWAVRAYRHDVESSLDQPGTRWHRAEIKKLSGKNLACWCRLVDKDGNPVPCHADVLLEIANALTPSRRNET